MGRAGDAAAGVRAAAEAPGELGEPAEEQELLDPAAAPGYERRYPKGSTSLLDGKWYHWSLVRDSRGTREVVLCLSAWGALHVQFSNHLKCQTSDWKLQIELVIWRMDFPSFTFSCSLPTSHFSLLICLSQS